MDKNSMHKTRQNCKLKMGLDEFLDMAFANKSIDAKIMCPCKNCGNESCVTVKVAKDHLNSVGFAEGYAKIIGPQKVNSAIPSHSQTSDENKMSVVEIANYIKLNDFEQGLLPPGLKGRKLHDFIAKLFHLKHSEHDPDKSISMLLELTKELFPVQEGADLPKSSSEMLPYVGEEEDKKPPRKKQNQPSVSVSSGCEEEDKTALGEKRNQPSASTSSGLVGYSTKEENRRKLREKINQRKESRSSRIR